jgi:hypothetical protein
MISTKAAANGAILALGVCTILLIYHVYEARCKKKIDATIETTTKPVDLMIALSRLFERHNILYCVWGTCCLNYHEVPTVILVRAFIVR